MGKRPVAHIIAMAFESPFRSHGGCCHKWSQVAHTVDPLCWLENYELGKGSTESWQVYACTMVTGHGCMVL